MCVFLYIHIHSVWALTPIYQHTHFTSLLSSLKMQRKLQISKKYILKQLDYLKVHHKIVFGEFLTILSIF
jgi:hypothetical protein